MGVLRLPDIVMMSSLNTVPPMGHKRKLTFIIILTTLLSFIVYFLTSSYYMQLNALVLYVLLAIVVRFATFKKKTLQVSCSVFFLMFVVAKKFCKL